jgi:hypothetical protein
VGNCFQHDYQPTTYDSFQCSLPHHNLKSEILKNANIFECCIGAQEVSNLGALWTCDFQVRVAQPVTALLGVQITYPEFFGG